MVKGWGFRVSSRRLWVQCQGFRVTGQGFGAWSCSIFYRCLFSLNLKLYTLRPKLYTLHQPLQPAPCFLLPASVISHKYPTSHTKKMYPLNLNPYPPYLGFLELCGVAPVDFRRSFLSRAAAQAGVRGLGFKVWVLTSKVTSWWFWILELGFRVEGLGFRASSQGFEILG